MELNAPTASRPPSPPLRLVRKVAVLLLGGTVLLIGVALIVLPGPAFVVIPAGLAILATEFLWARRLLDKAKEKVAQAAQRVKRAAPTDRG
jgi:tellurite resistance protein TerC